MEYRIYLLDTGEKCIDLFGSKARYRKRNTSVLRALSAAENLQQIDQNKRRKKGEDFHPVKRGE